MRKYAGILLMVCVIAGSAFATNSWNATTGSWGTPQGSASANWSSGIVPADTEQVKILGGKACTLDADAGTFTLNKVTVGTSGTMANLDIVSGGSITSVVEIQVGDAGGKIGTVIQTGGTVNLNGTSIRDSKLEVGYKGGPGFYTLSGGSVVGNVYSRLVVGPTGSVNGGVGTFTMQGTGGSISVTNLFVGVQDALGSYYGTGTLVYEIDGGVSAINAENVYIDPTNLAAAVANLNVTKTGALPIGDIILINNTGPNSVAGAFDNAAWGSTITLDGVNYALTNTYIGGLDGIANDVALTTDTFTLVYTAGANGSITGTTPQTVNAGTDGTAVTAQPDSGYHFVKWSDDSTANPRTDVNVTADITVTASFAIDTFTLVYTAGTNGSITGTTPQTVNSGTDGSAVTAQPDPCYHFVKWSDNSTANPRTDVNVTADITVQAIFATGTFTLTYTADANGSIVGTTPQTVSAGFDGTAVTAQPALGYHFVKWSDDSTANPRTDINVMANITVQASFAIGIETFTLTYTADANGSIVGTTPQTINSGADGTAVTAQPDLGYHFVKWSDDSTANPRTDLNVTADITVQASFAIDTFTLVYTAGANGSIIGTTPQTVNSGADGTAITAQPDPGYHFVSWSDDSTANPRTDLNVTADITVQASFAIGTFAFPGAEGSGCWATGGRGGDVYEVNNLTNAGPGSIVDALSEGNRTIVFLVSGTIELDGVMLEPKSNTTIAGQTAPGDGICIKGRIHILGGAHDIIIRYIRIRVDEGAANSSGDAIDIDDGSNIIIDHVSASYARDETISCQETSDYVTVQWCIMSEALTFEGHSYGSLVRGAYGQQKTYHHNLYAHNKNRNPRPGNYTDTGSDPEGLHFDFRNNVIYNWTGSHPGYNADTSSTSRYNFVGNVFIRGIESSGTKAFEEDSVGSYAYWSGNALGATYHTITVPSDQWSLIIFNGFSNAQIDEYKARSYQIPMEAVTTSSASLALTDVLAGAGARFPLRDSVDTRIVNDVISGTGSSITNTSSGSWPVLNSLSAPVDTDHDGMPDTWEIANGLNPDNAADRNNYDLNANYTNLEVYLYSLVTFTLTYTADANGSIIGTTPQTVNYGTDGTAVTAQPDTGYYFVKWSDDSTANPRTDVNVTADISVQAIFATGTFTLIYTAGANGSISGTTPQTVAYGTDGTAVTAEPAPGYHFVRWSDDSNANPRTDVNVMADITVRAFFAPDIILIVSKCKVAAGKTQYTGDSDFNDMKDSFTASGTMTVLPGDLNTIDHIDVNIISADGNSIFFESNDFNYIRNVQNNKFTHKYKIGKYNPTEGAITSLVIDFSKNTFAVTVSSADLTGLACPLQLIISLGDFVMGADVNEAIVNGTRKTIPTRLMRLYDDKLVVTKAGVHNSSRKWLNTLSVKGDIAVADMNLYADEPNLCSEDVILTWGDGNVNTQTFVIPTGSFTASRKGHTYKCVIEAVANDANIGIVVVKATLDLDKCMFKVFVRGASGLFDDAAGAAVFSVTFDTEEGTFDEEDNYTLP
jgi:uncharacterized repeat protein (TIGR02543 family)